MMCITFSHKKTESSISLKLKRSQAMKPELPSRKLNLDLDFLTPKCSRLYSSAEFTKSKDNPETTTEIDKVKNNSETTISQTTPDMLIDVEAFIPKSSDSKKNVNSQVDIGQPNRGNPYEESGKIFLFSDNQGQGIVQTLVNHKLSLLFMISK